MPASGERSRDERVAAGELLAEALAWGGRLAMELLGKRCAIYVTRSHVGFTMPGTGSRIEMWINPEPILRGLPKGYDLVRAAILHELGHHLHDYCERDHNRLAAKAVKMNLRPWFNALCDERLERRLRSRDAHWGRMLQSLAARQFKHEVPAPDRLGDFGEWLALLRLGFSPERARHEMARAALQMIPRNLASLDHRALLDLAVKLWRLPWESRPSDVAAPRPWRSRRSNASHDHCASPVPSLPDQLDPEIERALRQHLANEGAAVTDGRPTRNAPRTRNPFPLLPLSSTAQGRKPYLALAAKAGRRLAGSIPPKPISEGTEHDRLSGQRMQPNAPRRLAAGDLHVFQRSEPSNSPVLWIDVGFGNTDFLDAEALHLGKTLCYVIFTAVQRFEHVKVIFGGRAGSVWRPMGDRRTCHVAAMKPYSERSEQELLLQQGKRKHQGVLSRLEHGLRPGARSLSISLDHCRGCCTTFAFDPPLTEGRRPPGWEVLNFSISELTPSKPFIDLTGPFDRALDVFVEVVADRLRRLR